MAYIAINTPTTYNISTLKVYIKQREYSFLVLKKNSRTLKVYETQRHHP